jgi:hypothetical protein
MTRKRGGAFFFNRNCLTVPADLIVKRRKFEIKKKKKKKKKKNLSLIESPHHEFGDENRLSLFLIDPRVIKTQNIL